MNNFMVKRHKRHRIYPKVTPPDILSNLFYVNGMRALYSNHYGNIDMLGGRGFNGSAKHQQFIPIGKASQILQITTKPLVFKLKSAYCQSSPRPPSIKIIASDRHQPVAKISIRFLYRAQTLNVCYVWNSKSTGVQHMFLKCCQLNLPPPSASIANDKGWGEL